jgi:hypothetical protein
VIALDDDQSPAVITTSIVLAGDVLPEPVEVGGAYAAPSELTFPIEDLPDGSYSLRVDVSDESENPATDEITFTVVGNPADEGADDSGDAGGSGDASGSGDAGGSGETGDAGGASGDAGDSGGDAGVVDVEPTAAEGCDCRTDRSRPGLAMMLLLPLGLLVRRRRG